MKALVAAGTTEIQIDEAAPYSPPGGPPQTIDLINMAVDSVQAKIDLHVCFGNFRAGPPSRPAPMHRSSPLCQERKSNRYTLSSPTGKWRRPTCGTGVV